MKNEPQFELIAALDENGMPLPPDQEKTLQESIRRNIEGGIPLMTVFKGEDDDSVFVQLHGVDPSPELLKLLEAAIDSMRAIIGNPKTSH